MIYIPLYMPLILMAFKTAIGASSLAADKKLCLKRRMNDYAFLLEQCERRSYLQHIRWKMGNLNGQHLLQTKTKRTENGGL